MVSGQWELLATFNSTSQSNVVELTNSLAEYKAIAVCGGNINTANTKMIYATVQMPIDLFRSGVTAIPQFYSASANKAYTSRAIYVDDTHINAWCTAIDNGQPLSYIYGVK